MHKGPSGHGLRGHEGLFCRFKRLESDDKTGIVTLNTDLDSAIHILNYRLSSCTSDVASHIFKYRIALLTEKVTKTQKKLANVVSPLSVSNSFASLTVEDAEDKCTVDNVSTPLVYNIPRKSREGPKKGSTGDSKKAVLNSLLTPSDVSKSPKSINPEEPVLELRRSVTIEREVKVPVEVQGPAFPIKVDTLLDSGATGCFIDKSWALERQIELKPLKNPIPVLNVDGTRNQAGDITHFVSVIIKIGKHAEKLWCAVTCLGKTPLILGHTWLRKHNPDVDWSSGKITLNKCPQECQALLETRFAKLLRKVELQEMWVQAVKFHEQKPETPVNESLLEEAQKRVPCEYWKYLNVFSKTKSERMPVRKPWDHGIDLKQDFQTKKGRLIPLSVNEQKEVEAFLDDQLAKGYIRPSISPQTSPIFFIPKKDGKKCMVQDYRYVSEFTIKNNWIPSRSS